MEYEKITIISDFILENNSIGLSNSGLAVLQRL